MPVDELRDIGQRIANRVQKQSKQTIVDRTMKARAGRIELVDVNARIARVTFNDGGDPAAIPFRGLVVPNIGDEVEVLVLPSGESRLIPVVLAPAPAAVGTIATDVPTIEAFIFGTVAPGTFQRPMASADLAGTACVVMDRGRIDVCNGMSWVESSPSMNHSHTLDEIGIVDPVLEAPAFDFGTEAPSLYPKPAASADNAGTAILVQDELGTRTEVSNGMSWVQAAPEINHSHLLSDIKDADTGSPATGIDQYLFMPYTGVIGSDRLPTYHATAPDSAGLSLTDDFDIRFRLGGVDLTLGLVQALVSKGYSYLVYALNNTLSFRFWDVAPPAAPITATSAALTGISAAGNPIWLRITRVRSTGAVTFYWSNSAATTPPTLWTQIGLSVVRATTAVYNSGELLYIGADGGPPVGHWPTVGRIYYAQLCGTVNATATDLRLDANFSSKPSVHETFYAGANVTVREPNPGDRGTVYAAAYGASPAATAAQNDAALTLAIAKARLELKTLKLDPGVYHLSVPFNCRDLTGGNVGCAVVGESTTLMQDADNLDVMRVNGGGNRIQSLSIQHANRQTAAMPNGNGLVCMAPPSPTGDKFTFFSVFKDLSFRRNWRNFYANESWFSNTAEDMTFYDFEGWAIYMTTSGTSTGSNWGNLYINGAAAAAWPGYVAANEAEGVPLIEGGIFIDACTEMTFRQVNIEWGRYKYPIFLSRANGVKIDALHFEGVRPVNTLANGTSAAWGAAFNSLITLTNQSRLMVDALQLLRLVFAQPLTAGTVNNGATYPVGRAGLTSEYSVFGFPAVTCNLGTTPVAIPSSGGGSFNDESEAEIRGFNESLHLTPPDWPGTTALRRVKGVGQWLTGNGLRFPLGSFPTGSAFSGGDTIPAGRTNTNAKRALYFPITSGAPTGAPARRSDPETLPGLFDPGTNRLWIWNPSPSPNGTWRFVTLT